MTFTQLAWAAGLFEGEGCVGCHKSKGTQRRLLCRLTSTDEDVIRRFANVIGVGTVYGPHMHRSGKWKPYWTWSTNTFEAAQAVIALLWGWLGERRRTAAKAALVTYHTTRVESRKPFKLSRRCTPATLADMQALSDSGVSQSEIARVCRRTPSSVSKLLSGARKARG